MIKDEDIKLYEETCGHIFSGLQMYVRDTFLDQEVEEKYIFGKLLREPTYCDVSDRVGGMITSHRYAILSNRFVDFRTAEHGTNWGLHVCKRGSYFKVLDIYKLENKTQISILHLDENWRVFENTMNNVEENIIKMSRERFENKLNYPPIPELATKQWLTRLLHPIGLNINYDYNSLFDETLYNDSPEILAQIEAMDSAIEKGVKLCEERNQRKGD